MPTRPSQPTIAEQWKKTLGNLKTWKRGSQRAVHKPLLTLMLIARARQDQEGRVRFAEIADQLESLLREFGPPRQSYHPEYPFWHLGSDGFWTVERANEMPLRQAGHSPSRSTLMSHDATGLVRTDLWDGLKADAELRDDLVSLILDSFWPPTLHEAIRQAMGLPERAERTLSPATRAKRDPQFREEVLRAYERRCAVCGYDGRLGNSLLGLEAAHVQWHAYEGPDVVENGLALCSFHHVALDKGAIGLGQDLSILVSSNVSGQTMLAELLYGFSKRQLRRPQSGFPVPAESYVRWHHREVFQGPERAACTSSG